ncbi:MAG: hypothetical protein ACYDH3_00300 [Candidatus Aminicenantales bacterium]
MKQKIVGTFPLGLEYCELVLREGTGGEFYVMPEEGHVPRIKVGADHDEWGEVAEVILHEAMELALARIKCRFYVSDACGDDMHNYLFVAQHKDFSDACARTMWFLLKAIPEALEAWKAWKQAEKAIAKKLNRTKR